MTKLSRDEVEKLTAEEQMALGESVARRTRHRQQLLYRARGGAMWLERSMIPCALLVMVVFAGRFGVADPERAKLLLLGAIVLIALAVQNHLLIRRQDALMDLLEPFLHEERENPAISRDKNS